MQGFKCDRCGMWFEGHPVNQGCHSQMIGTTDIYSMSVSAKISLTEGCAASHDLCLGCFLYCLEQFLRVCRQDWQKRS